MSDGQMSVYYREPAKVTHECVLEQVVALDGVVIVKPVSQRRAAWLAFQINGALARRCDDEAR